MFTEIWVARNLQNDHVFADPSMKKINIPNHQVNQNIYKVFHCDGLLLCKLTDPTKILVWNPYLGQTRLIQTRTKAWYVLGYDNNHCHKSWRFLMITKASRSMILALFHGGFLMSISTIIDHFIVLPCLWKEILIFHSWLILKIN